MKQYDVDRIVLALVEEGQDNSEKYGFNLGKVMRFTPMQVGTILSDLDIEPERKTGRWINHPEQKNIYGGVCVECSECGEKYIVQYIKDEKFCRNCGAYMGGDT